MWSIEKTVPLIGQIKNYRREYLGKDLVAACVVTIMLIPQSMAYAMLAGVPPVVGLYASMLPLLGYALFGSCNTLAVGPVAIASLMTASALGQVTQTGSIGYLEGAMLLALMSGLFMLLLGVLRFGFLSNFLSHSVVVGFITASSFLIALSQLKHILGVNLEGHTFFATLHSLTQEIAQTNLVTSAVGGVALLFLFWARQGAVRFLLKFGLSQQSARTLSKVAPVIGIIVSTLVVASFSLDQYGVSIVGTIPLGLPAITLPSISVEAIKTLMLPAILISIIGFVESVSVGKTLASKRRERINGNNELIGLGVANIASGLSGAFPVSGGFARSVVNFDAGAKTQMAGVFTAIGIGIAALVLTPFLYYLPNAMLAAMIIVAVLSLLDLSIFKRAWGFSKSDFWAVLITVLLTLGVSVEMGVAAGIVTSILLHLYHTSNPHIAEIGLINNTEHFRNIKHFNVETKPNITSLRIDESLLFSNASYLEDYIDDVIRSNSKVEHIILHCGAINDIDLSALEMLEGLNRNLSEQGISLHMSEIKVPVYKLLDKVGFFDKLSGQVFLAQYQAYSALSNNDHSETSSNS